MEYPTLTPRAVSRDMVDAFGGYNHNLRIGGGEFYDMQNMTSDHYPVLAPRRQRAVYLRPDNPQGLIAKDALCYIDGSRFVMNEYSVDLGLSTEEEDCPKRLVSMGAYVIILPDKKWINTLNLTEFGSVEADFESSSDVSFALCTIDGTEYTDVTVGDVEPMEPSNMQLWMDTSSEPHVLKKYSSSSAMWVSIATTYIKIYSTGLGAAFSQYDGVTIAGILDERLQDLNGSHVIWNKGEDYIVVAGLLDAAVTQTGAEGSIRVSRKMPNMDFIIESENRLWGCRYGVAANGEVVNEIYASKLGDFKNWNCFMNLSTDSYAASCGTDGRFTGAITHLGYPLFFKENFLHKIYGNYPANFQIQTTPLRGVQRSCDRSLAIVNEVLYYKSSSGICAYDGSLPAVVSAALGDKVYDSAVGGSVGNKYYISMREIPNGEWSLLVYDTSRGMWHKEDSFHAEAFCRCRSELYAISTGAIYAMLGSGDDPEDSVFWMVESGDIGLSLPDAKYISRLTVRLSVETGACVRIFARYDFSREWESVAMLRGGSLRSFSLPIRPKRCDTMQLRFEGQGMCRIYSICKTIEQGSERA